MGRIKDRFAILTKSPLFLRELYCLGLRIGVISDIEPDISWSVPFTMAEFARVTKEGYLGWETPTIEDCGGNYAFNFSQALDEVRKFSERWFLSEWTTLILLGAPGVPYTPKVSTAQDILKKGDIYVEKLPNQSLIPLCWEDALADMRQHPPGEEKTRPVFSPPNFPQPLTLATRRRGTWYIVTFPPGIPGIFAFLQEDGFITIHAIPGILTKVQSRKRRQAIYTLFSMLEKDSKRVSIEKLKELAGVGLARRPNWKKAGLYLMAMEHTDIFIEYRETEEKFRLKKDPALEKRLRNWERLFADRARARVRDAKKRKKI